MVCKLVFGYGFHRIGDYIFMTGFGNRIDYQFRHILVVKHVVNRNQTGVEFIDEDRCKIRTPEKCAAVQFLDFARKGDSCNVFAAAECFCLYGFDIVEIHTFKVGAILECMGPDGLDRIWYAVVFVGLGRGVLYEFCHVLSEKHAVF